MFQNEELWRGLRDGSGYTVLAPNEAAFNKLEDKRRSQLKDPRNGEVVEQIGAYHVISDPVSKDDLYESSGVVTAGGRIDVGRSVTNTDAAFSVGLVVALFYVAQAVAPSSSSSARQV